MNPKLALAPLLPLALLAACGGAPTAPAVPDAASARPAPTVAATAATAPITIAIEARSGSKLTGTATFAAVDGGVKVTLALTGATPGKLASHVHEKGDCSAPDAKSAGGHFNPAGHKHGLPGGERHLGDLGNIDIGPDGTGTHEILVPGANLTPGDPSSFLGKAIIVHEKLDDGGQPVGNAGGRIGCGVIEPKK